MITTREQLKAWFRNGLYPTENQFANWIDSFWHKNDQIPLGSVENLAAVLNHKADTGHTHGASDIDGLQNLLDDKADTEHTHSVSDIDGLENSLSTKADLEHRHTTDEIDGLTDALAGKADSGHTHTMGNVTGLIDALKEKAAAIHSHAIESITGLADALAGKAAASHSHTTAEVSGLNDELAKKSNTGHGHKMGAIEGLSDALSGKADSVHTHTMGDVTGLVGALKEKAAAIHSHAIESITGLADALAGKQATISDLASIRSGAAAGATALQTHQDISGKQDKTDSSLPTVAKTIVGAIKELLEKFKDFLRGIQHVTWEELKELRDNGELVAGQWYRITDYVTTIANDPEARSAGHPFDLLVMADDVTTLSENARAIKHAGDSYFADSKLSAWRIKYCLDNDMSRWYWADADSGKGVIYFMEDEFGNSGDYDFKNFQHKRYRVTDDSNDGILGSLDGQYVGFNDEMKDLIIEDFDDYIWAYAASMPSYTLNEDTGELEFDMQDQHDATLNCLPEGTAIDADGGGYAHPVIFCKGNKFVTHQIGVAIDEVWTYPQRVSDIVLFCYPKYFWGEDDIPARVEFENSADNIFAPDSDYITANGVFARNTFLTAYSNIIFGGSVGRSTFKGECSCCTFGGEIWRTTFGGYIGNTTFGGYIDYTTFGGYIYGTTFGGYIYGTTFGGYIDRVTFGGEIWNTTFGGYIRDTTFGGNIGSTTFGGEIWRTTFGGGLYNTTFGGHIDCVTFGGCLYETTFGGEIGNTTFGGNLSNGHIHGYLYCLSIGSSGETWSNLVIDPGVENVYITCAEPGNRDIKNVHVFSGVCGTNSSPLTVSVPTRDNVLLEIKPTGKTEVFV